MVHGMYVQNQRNKQLGHQNYYIDKFPHQVITECTMLYVVPSLCILILVIHTMRFESASTANKPTNNPKHRCSFTHHFSSHLMYYNKMYKTKHYLNHQILSLCTVILILAISSHLLTNKN